MDITLLKSFLPEIFFSIAILLQIVFNSRFVNKLEFNFPIIYKETLFQIFFILFCLTFLYYNLKVEGFFFNYLFINDVGSCFLKFLFSIFSSLSLFFIGRSFYLQSLNFFEYFSIFLLSLFV